MAASDSVGWMAANWDTANDMHDRRPQHALPSNAVAAGHAQDPSRAGATASQHWAPSAPSLSGEAADRPHNRGSVFCPSVCTSLIATSPRWVLGLIVVAGLLAGCTSSSPDSPPLADSTFARVLVDVHLAQTRHGTHANQSAAPPPPRDSIFAHHGIRATAFEATLRHYSRRPEALARIYQSVIDTLTARRQAARRAARAASADSASAARPRP
jgi:hypothetical protein